MEEMPLHDLEGMLEKAQEENYQEERERWTGDQYGSTVPDLRGGTCIHIRVVMLKCTHRCDGCTHKYHCCESAGVCLLQNMCMMEAQGLKQAQGALDST